MVDDREVELVAAACRALGDPVRFEAPTGYPNSLALCILDSVWSLGVKYQSVENVVYRWKQYAINCDIDPERASANDLIDTIDLAGSVERFIQDVVRNRQLTSTTNGILKADAVYQCAEALLSVQVNTTAELRRNAHVPEVKKAWKRVPGQISSLIGWRYLLMLANVEDVKPDRMLNRFVARAIDRKVTSDDEVRALVLAAHKLLVNDEGRPTVRALDHEIWSRQRGR